MTLLTVAKVGQDLVNGGKILGGGQNTVRYAGQLIAVVNDAVESHAPGHSGVTLVQGSTTVKINGKSIVRHTDLASCGHPVTVVDLPGTVKSG